MVDIIPASMLSGRSDGIMQADSVEQDSSKQIEVITPYSENEGSSSDSQDQKPSKKGMIISLIIALIVLVVGILVAAFRVDVLSQYFSGTVSLKQDDSSYSFIDEDDDGLTTVEELAAGTLVNEPDTDNDGMPDGYEVKNGLNPLASADAVADADGDELLNVDEYFYETLINDSDTDKDGFKDGSEVKNGFSPVGSGLLEKKNSREVSDFTERVGDAEVVINSESFRPELVRLTVGQSVTFQNEDTVSHFITGPEIETGNILPDESFTLDFKSAGSYSFFDRDDAKYKGRIIVEDREDF